MNIRVFVPTQGAFAETHVLRQKDQYYATFVLPILSALEQTKNVEVVLTTEPQNHTPNTWLLRLDYPDIGSVKAAIDYTDTTGLWTQPERGSCDLLFKLKYSSRSTGTYQELERKGIPVAPGGYVLAPDGNLGNVNADYLLANLDRLRAIQRLEEPTDKFLTAYAYRAKESCPERQALFSPKWANQPKWPFVQYAEKIARSRFVLNGCGPHGSIDRKVVEFCAVGAAILSGRGLEDLVLPNCGRFLHGKNVWFVDTIQDIDKALRMDENQRRTLVDGSTVLFDRVFSRKIMGNWFVTKSHDTVLQRS